MSEYPCLPPITDHAFMRLVRERCKNMDRSMAEIAEELGCNVDDLVRWIMAYREPKKHRSVDTTKYGPAIAFDGRAIRTNADLSSEAARFKAWKRQHDGAKAARADA
jgi:transposase-like protein